MKDIYLAGGCFWGTQKYFDLVPGVKKTEVGYANGKTQNPTYEDVCYSGTDHAETVHIQYDETRLSLETILTLYYDAIDPTAVNRQGGDVGRQYRTGIYYTDPTDLPRIRASLDTLQKQLVMPIAIEAKPLRQFFPAEETHQKYLDKHPGGYCHIGPELFARAAQAPAEPAPPPAPTPRPSPGNAPSATPAVTPAPNIVAGAAYPAPSADTLRQQLTPLQYDVTQNSATEPPFQNEFWDNHRRGIYVDVTTGQPLFVSSDKFDSGCGWPSFSRPIDPAALREIKDASHGLIRTEVRSTGGDAHLGHVFTDGPAAAGGLRYCINSASLRFIPAEEMEKEGYGAFLPLVGGPAIDR